MIGLPYRIGLGLVALIGAYGFGRWDGARIEQNAHLRAERKAAEVTIQLEDARSESSAQFVQGQQIRATTVKEIYHETERLVRDPSFSGMCVDAGAVKLLDDAVAVANGKDRGAPVGDASGVPEGAADGHGDDGSGLRPVD